MTLQELFTLLATLFPNEKPQKVFDELEERFPVGMSVQDVIGAIVEHLQGEANPLLTPVTNSFLPEEEAPPAPTEAEQRSDWFVNFMLAMTQTGLLDPNDEVDEALSNLIVTAFNDALDAGIHLDKVTAAPYLDEPAMVSAFAKDIDFRLEAVLTQEEPDEEKRRELRRLRGFQTERESADLEAERRTQMHEMAQRAGLFEGADATRIAEISQWLESFLTDINIRESAGQQVDFTAELEARIVEGLPVLLVNEADQLRVDADRQRRAAALGLPGAEPVDEAAVEAGISEAGQRQLERFSAQQQAKREEEEQAARAVGQRRSEQRAVAAGKILPPGPPGGRLAEEPVPLGTQFSNFIDSELGKSLSPEQLALLGINQGLLLDEFGVAQEAREQEIAERRESLVEFAASEQGAEQAAAFAPLLTPQLQTELAATGQSAVSGLFPEALTFEAFLPTVIDDFLARAETRQLAERDKAEKEAAQAVIRRQKLLEAERKKNDPIGTPAPLAVFRR